jgi:hypothetical protein
MVTDSKHLKSRYVYRNMIHREGERERARARWKRWGEREYQSARGERDVCSQFVCGYWRALSEQYREW